MAHGNKKSFWDFFARDISLLTRMMVIFVLGAGIPLLISYIFIYMNVRGILRDDEIKYKTGIVSLISVNMSNRMLAMDNITHYLGLDLALSGLREPDFSNLSVVSKYQNTYENDVERLVCYHYDVNLAETNTFKYADATIKSSRWYINTMNAGGEVYWFYEFNEENSQSKLCAARLITGMGGKKLGVIYAVMNMDTIQGMIDESEPDTFLLYDNITVICKNTYHYDIDDLLYALKNTGDNPVYRNEYASTIETYYMGKESYLTSCEVSGKNGKTLFTIASVAEVDKLSKPDNTSILLIFIPFLAGIVLSVALIFFFSNSYSKRVSRFRRLLHDEAAGERVDLPLEVTGTDEVGLMARDLYSIIMESQNLSNQVMEQRIGKEKLKAREREVEFRMLSSQINPHFLYNTLETMRMRALINKDKDVADLAKMLAEVMRHNLKVRNSLERVSEELKYVKYYMQIQDYRFRDRISYEIDADMEELAGYYMIPLAIQPFVENAYVHGLESLESDGFIKVTVQIRGEGEEEELFISVKDNGPGMDEETLEAVRRNMADESGDRYDHIGVKNIASRIRILYGDEYGVEIDSAPGNGTDVRLHLPVIREAK